MFTERLLTWVLPLFEYMRRALWLSAISTVIGSPNLFVVKIAALIMAFEIYVHFKSKQKNLEMKAHVYFIDCDIMFHQKEKALLNKYAKMIRSLRPDI